MTAPVIPNLPDFPIENDPAFNLKAAAVAAAMPGAISSMNDFGAYLNAGSYAAQPSGFLATDIATTTVPAAMYAFVTSGYSEHGKGSGLYINDSLADSALAAAHPRFCKLSVDGRYWRLDVSERLNVAAAGAAFDDVTDDYAAFAAAIAYLKAMAPVDAVYYKGSAPLFVPALGTAYISTTLDITHTLVIEGVNAWQQWGVASRLRFPESTTGIRIQGYNTNGASGTDGSPFHYSGSGTLIRNLCLFGPIVDTTVSLSGGEAEYHGIHARSIVGIENVYINGFRGDGIHAFTSAGGGGAEEGGSNLSYIRNAWIESCRNGVFIDGADANVWDCQHVVTRYCRRSTIWDSSFLGNSHRSHHSTAVGLIPGVDPAMVHSSGNIFAVVLGQETWASTHAPSSTTPAERDDGGNAADNQGWLWVRAGSADASLNIANWSSGTTYRAAGPYMTDSANGYNTFMDCYSEGGEPPAQLAFPTQWFGGLSGSRWPVMSGGEDWGGGTRIQGHTLIAPQNVVLGKTLVSSTTGGTTQVFELQNRLALASSVANRLRFSMGFASDGVTPLKLADIYASSDSSNTSTYSGALYFCTRRFSDGAMVERVMVDGPNGAFRAEADNDYDLGLTSRRWRNFFCYTGDFNGALTTKHATSGLGYATGAGGTVTQATSRTTGVTLNKVCGAITLVSAAGSTTEATFTVTNSTVAATDTVVVSQKSGTDKYIVGVSAVAAGSFAITFRTFSGTTTEQPVFNFAVLKAVTS